MAKCDECGRYENLPYQCRRCGQTFCAEHRLPENHDCPGLNEWNDPQGVFGTASRGETRTPRRAEATGGLRRVWRSYFHGNITYIFLALMWLTFIAQLVVAQFVSRALMYDLFVLRPTQLEYVWTWVTSVFAHGGPYHIAANSIGLYFFGPPVERRLGSKRYAALFLVAGAAAGLAQIAVGFALGEAVAGVLGASGALMAIMGVLTVLNPGLRVYLYFVIPMPLWVLTIGFAVISVFWGFGQIGGGGGVAHWAHLAGLVIGVVYGETVKGETQAPESLRFGRGGRGRGPF